MTLLLFVNLIGSFAADYWLKHYAPRQPSVASPFPINLGPETVAFVPSWLGRYEHWSFWLHFVFLGLLFLMICGYALNAMLGLRELRTAVAGKCIQIDSTS
jgi:hypothetical protein